MHFINKQCLFTCFGLVLVSVGIFIAIFWIDIFNSILANELELTKTSKSFEMWKQPPLSLNFDVYLYNWTNPRNLSSEDYEKPILEEIGPYRFREKQRKTRIQWQPNSTLSYRRYSSYYFVEEESKGKLDDIITTINAVAVSAAHTARNWNYVMQKQVSMGLSLYNQQAFVTKEARELLFDGYQDDLIDMANEMSKFGPFTLNIPYDRFGWLYQRNESDDLAGHFNIHTGKGNISELGVTKMWNRAKTTPFYPSPCNEVRGSGGEFYPPGQTKHRPLEFFSGELCRYLNLYFTDEEEINGLNVYKYAATERSVDNGTKYSEHKCFSIGDSLPSGVMNVSSCRFGAPVFVSFPHFYAADSYYLQFVDGQNPDKDKHEFYIKMDPNAGVPVEVAARLQINVMVQGSPNIGLFQEAPLIFFPAMWFEQKVRIPNEMIDELKIAASMPIIGYICTGIMIIVGIIVVIIGLIGYQQTNQTKHINDTIIKDNLPNAISSNEKPSKLFIQAEQSPLVQQKMFADIFDMNRAKPAVATLAIPESDFE